MGRYDDNNKVGYWQSYSDMMAALLLVFVLIISYTLLQSKFSYQKKEEELRKKEGEIKASQALLEEKDAEISEKEGIVKKQQKKIDRIVGVKSDIIAALSDEFESKEWKVYVDQQTGAIKFDSSVLFDTNKYDLKKSGIKFLDEFIPKYFEIILSEEFSKYVSEIIIEGHTDTDGTYMKNLKLSQERAFAVASYCLDDQKKLLNAFDMDKIRSMVTANGKSWSDPVYRGKSKKVDKDSSRRVEFKFRLKNEEMIDEMKKMLESSGDGE